MTPFPSPAHTAQKSPTSTVNESGRGNGQPGGQLDVGASLSDAELIRHVQDCGRHMLAHYERFETLGDPADREAAQHWLKAQNEAQAALSDAGKAEREAEIQRAIDDGVGYFAARGAADRERLVA
jgi:hypothetical protein